MAAFRVTRYRWVIPGGAVPTSLSGAMMTEWNVEGSVLIACNCDWGCPCNFNARPTRGYCQGGWTWMIERGSVAGVRVDGLAVSLYGKWPGAIHEGGGEAVSFIDEAGDEAQRSALTRLVRGEAGGPWRIFSGTYSLAGPHARAYDVELAGYRTRLTIGAAVQLEFQPMRNPVSGAEAHPEMVLPEGLVLKRGALAASHVFRVNEGVNYDHSGKYTAFGRFAYEGSI